MTPPAVSDGPALWRLVRETGVLDVNSPYLYLLIGAHFCDTSVVARRGGGAEGDRGGDLLGAITGYLPPRAMSAPPASGGGVPLPRADVLFVWQVGVAAHARGMGLASAMLDHLLARPACAGVRWVETTVSPSNRASRAMFESLARRLGADCAEAPGFARALFPDTSERGRASERERNPDAAGGADARAHEPRRPHEEERLLRIGPFAPGGARPVPQRGATRPTEGRQ